MDTKIAALTALILSSPATADAVTAASAPASPSSTYTVTVTDQAPDSVHVNATFLLESDVLSMYITSSPQLEDGQAALVRNLVVRDSDGETIPLEYTGLGDWKLPGTEPGQRVEIDYDVALEHDQYAWGPGIDEVAYKQDDGLFFTGFSLFLLPGMDSTDPITVHFDLPADWRASTPWQRAMRPAPLRANGEAGGETYLATGPMDLARNCMFLGEHLEETVSLEGFTFVLAIGGDLKAKKQLFVDAMAPLLPAYVETFGGMPKASRYLVVINAGDRSDGGAFPGSYSMLIKGEVNRGSSMVWGHGIAHELLHFWNGHTLFPAHRSDEEWFKEGFTDYLTIAHLSRSGLDTRQVTYRKLENMARRYTLAKMLMGIEDSMRAAGANKHRARFLVYGGGALVGLALDVRLREATQNAAGLDDLMHAMYDEFGAPGKAYAFEDIVRLASRISGQDQSEFFEQFVDGTAYLEVGPYFERIGLQMTTVMDEFYLAPRQDATPDQRAIAGSMFGQAFASAR